jgi:hypothetical protein
MPGTSLHSSRPKAGPGWPGMTAVGLEQDNWNLREICRAGAAVSRLCRRLSCPRRLTAITAIIAPCDASAVIRPIERLRPLPEPLTAPASAEDAFRSAGSRWVQPSPAWYTGCRRPDRRIEYFLYKLRPRWPGTPICHNLQQSLTLRWFRQAWASAVVSSVRPAVFAEPIPRETLMQSG